MRWLLAMPALGAVALILAIEVRANAEPADAAEVTTVSTERVVRRASPRYATAFLQPASGSEVTGVIRFWEIGDGRVGYDVELTGVPPGTHGFHVHEVGDCSASDATSAGGHFNPDDMPHGGPDDAQRHVGDLGNVVADEDGRVELTGADPVITLRGSHSILGRAMMVHANPDDLESQPTGDAGARIGCGVIRRLPDTDARPPREEG